MKKSLFILVALVALSFQSATAQVYAKINALYAVVGVANPSVEAAIAPHSSFSIDATFSPWRSVKGRHLFFGMFNGEYRYYIKRATEGFYAAFNAGGMGFDINKPYLFKGGKLLGFNVNYGKGFGLIVGLCAGYQHHFAERWTVDAFVGVGYLRSWYNGYQPDGTIVMSPQGHEDYEKPDPFNGSSEVMPFKAGISIGYRIFNPNRHK
ncbi:MAG: DUF3575 domain-containing protein [Alistipes sp.]|nr:DUF3575 domain-containing protein [Alistipes sp.]